MTAWQTLFLSDDEATASCYGKSVRFFMKSGMFTGLASLFADREFSPADPDMV